MSSIARRLGRNKPKIYVKLNLQQRESPCPKCRTILDAAASVRSNKKTDPAIEPGAFTMCCACGQLLKFGPLLNVEVATEAEIRAGLAPNIAEHLLAVSHDISGARPN